MAEIWIQLENRAWDTMPNNIDRMTGKTAQVITGKAPVNVTIASPGTGVTKTRKMFAPLQDGSGKIIEALIFRRYKAPVQPDQSDAWTVPDDRKVNPWDINEPNPTDNGTMGTIPGPVIECSVGDSVLVHFRNLDMRTNKSVKARAHSMHVHGFVFESEHDGAYPLSPADPSQPVPASERTAWNDVGVTGASKMGDRVPPGGTFNYTWKTVGWPSTTGVWLYHDHSFCDMENMELGAIGMVVIHNESDNQNDFTLADADFPSSNPNGNPIQFKCRPIDIIRIDKSILQHVGVLDKATHDLIPHTHGHEDEHAHTGLETLKKGFFDPDITRVVKQGDILLHVDHDFRELVGICFRTYKTPPAKAQYLQLYHEMNSAPGMCINGRTFLGNTPTVVGGTSTKMRFGVVGMGTSAMGFHTFHIHGHRWTIPGPDGNTPGAIQSSSQIKAVSQFEDTRTFGPANSFVFTINGASGSFMRAGGPSPTDAKGEWHMHCHVLNHMMSGMMGSLLIVEGGDFAGRLPVGEECTAADVVVPPGPVAHTVNIIAFSFPAASSLPVHMGDTVRFINNHNDIHSVVWDTAGAPGASPIINTGGAFWDVVMSSMGTFNYHCGVHGAGMSGSITVVM
jgi:FtsP/CotA-like multicopper oxidase with cupredoxin domain/plastocyanin